MLQGVGRRSIVLSVSGCHYVAAAVDLFMGHYLLVDHVPRLHVALLRADELVDEMEVLVRIFNVNHVRQKGFDLVDKGRTSSAMVRSFSSTSN